MTDKRVYYYFYLMGREEPVDLRSLTVEDLVSKVLGSQAIRSVAIEAARGLFSGMAFNRLKSEWIAGNVDEIHEAGGNSDRAFELYVNGRIDQTATELEQEMVTEMVDMLDAIDMDAEEEDDIDTDEDDEDDVNEPSDFEDEDEDEENEDDDGEPPDEPDIIQSSTAKPLSLQAQYAQWEVRGRDDAKASTEDMDRVREMANGTLKRAQDVATSFLASNSRRIRRDWRAAHLATLGDLRPAKAYGRWLDGWTEYATEVAAEVLKKKAS